MAKPKVSIRLMRISDAKTYYKILNNPHFIYFRVKPKSVKAEETFLKKLVQNRKKGYTYDYAILYEGKIIGGCGIKIDQHRKHIGEIGYFLDESFWGKGITTKAVKILEKIGFNKLKLRRIEIILDLRNKASEKVAIKCGYKKEGIMKKVVKNMKNKYVDSYLYAKVK